MMSAAAEGAAFPRRGRAAGGFQPKRPVQEHGHQQAILEQVEGVRQ